MYCTAAALTAGVLYVLSNHILFFPAHVLPLTWLDQAVPFVPETVWLYNSDMILFFSAYIISKDLTNTNQYLYQFLLVLFVSIAVFFAWPVSYPRHLFPLPSALDPWTFMIFHHLRSVDTPTNCLPSLHVSMSYLSAFIFVKEQRKKFPFFFSWATLVALSTLTTKQHYVVDVLAGLALAIAAYFIFNCLVNYSNVSDQAYRR